MVAYGRARYRPEGSRHRRGSAGRACLILQSSDEFAERKSLLRRAAEAEQRDAAPFGLAAAARKNVRDFRQAVLASLVADLLAAGIGRDAQPRRAQLGRHLLGVSGRVVGDRGHDGLYRGKPEREIAGVMLYQNADKALER